jgi:hypothetical protein
MKLRIVTCGDKLLVVRDYRDLFKIKVESESGKTQVISFYDSEPEDNCLARNFNDVYQIPYLLELAYKAGEKGEGFSVDEIEANSYDELDSEE